MDPASIVDSEQTQFHPQMDRQTDGKTDGRTDVKPVKPAFNFAEVGGIISVVSTIIVQSELSRLLHSPHK